MFPKKNCVFYTKCTVELENTIHLKIPFIEIFNDFISLYKILVWTEKHALERELFSVRSWNSATCFLSEMTVE